MIHNYSPFVTCGFIYKLKSLTASEIRLDDIGVRSGCVIAIDRSLITNEVCTNAFTFIRPHNPVLNLPELAGVCQVLFQKIS